jgi:histidinol phosphatase-like PHP family hydrolase
VTWQPIDCHAHTTMSDGSLTVDELIAVVTARGVRPGVADHLSGDVRYSIKTVDAVRAYLDELERHDVARGGEFCWHDVLWRELPDEVALRFTHTIGSLHAIFAPAGDRVISVFSPTLPDGITPDVYMEMHVANLERFALEMPVDILAHPTLLPIPFRTMPLEELWTEEREERAVCALARAGITFEVSSRYRPHPRFVRRAMDAGVRLSLGSDGHTAEQVGDIGFSLSLVRALGAREEELYDPIKHGSRLPRRGAVGAGRSRAG